MYQRIFFVLFALFGAAVLQGEMIGDSLYSTSASGVATGCNSPVLVQRFPAAVFGNTYYLAVWSDGNRSPNKKSSDIYCARIDSATGQSLDPNGILVCNADYNQSHPMVAFDGTNFLVVWEDFRNNRNYDVYGARVTEAGVVLDPNGFPIMAKVDTNHARPVVAFANGNYFVAWNDARHYPAYSIYGTRVTPAGLVLDPNGILIDAESQAKIDSLKPASSRWGGNKEFWFQSIKSFFSVGIAASNKSCHLSYLQRTSEGSGGVFTFTQLKTCQIDPQTGSFIRRPVIQTSASKIAVDVSGMCSTPNGFTLAVGIGCPGWSTAPNFYSQRYDSTMKTKDSVLFNGSYCMDQPRLYNLSPDAGTANNVRGQAGLQKFASAFDGKNIVHAMELYWYKTGVTVYSTGIFLVRSSLTNDTLIDLKNPIRLEETSRTTGTSVHGEVNWPYLAQGPNNSCILLYEKNYGVDNRQVICRVLREHQ